MKNTHDNPVVKVAFEPAGWRTAGDTGTALSLKDAYMLAVEDAEWFLTEKRVNPAQGGVFGPEDGYQRVIMQLPESLVKDLESQPFVGREYPDQTKSTLRVLSR